MKYTHFQSSRPGILYTRKILKATLWKYWLSIIDMWGSNCGEWVMAWDWIVWRKYFILYGKHKINWKHTFRPCRHIDMWGSYCGIWVLAWDWIASTEVNISSYPGIIVNFSCRNIQIRLSCSEIFKLGCLVQKYSN